jgi:hypothetical protein
MSAKAIFIFVLILFSKIENNYGQELDRCWPLGLVDWVPMQESNLVFTSLGFRIDTVYRSAKFGSECASISDSLGHMKFFSNGCMVGNADNDTMVNGANLNSVTCPRVDCEQVGGIVTQGCLILPDPGNANRFYLFHQPCGANVYPTNLFVSMVDMSLDSGRGAVVGIDSLIYSNAMCDASLTAVKHANGIDWWIFVHERFTNRFVRYLLTGSGLSGPFFQSIGIVYNDDGHGLSKFSSDGKWFASSTQFGGIDLYNFDRCNGELSNYLYIDMPDSSFINFVEFSPNSRFLYSVWKLDIHQFDLNSGNIPMSNQQVAILDTFISLNSRLFFWLPQVGPDGKIYISTAPANKFLHVIEHPDSIGQGCTVLQHSIALPNSNYTLPNFPNYRLGPVDSLYCDTINQIRNYFAENKNISIFPNPASNEISIRCENPYERIESLLLSDEFGQTLLYQKSSDDLLDVANQGRGLYFLVVETNRGKYYKKVVVVR